MDEFSAYVKMSKQISCDVCLKTFATRSHLLRHKQEHAGDSTPGLQSRPRGGWTWLCCVISRDGSKNFNIRTCEHIILGRLRMGASQAKNTLPNVQCSVNCGFGAKNIFLTEDH